MTTRPAPAAPSPLTLPDDDDGWRAWLLQRCDDQIDRARRLVDELRDLPGEVTAADVLARWNLVTMALVNAMSASSVMSNVLPAES
ncbi:MAG: hypothetical protein WBV37_06260, partial [Nocardioidaceae bacterium]